jgi:hypothetical protein
MHRHLLAACLLVVLTVCTPTEPCACPPGTTLAVVYGRVATPDGVAVANARVEVELFPGSCGSGPDVRGSNIGQRFVNSGTNGQYRVEARSVHAPGPACATARVVAGADTVRGTTAPVALRARPPLDSARVDITLQQAAARAW